MKSLNKQTHTKQLTPKLLSGVSGHGFGGLVSQWDSTKEPPLISAHCHRQVGVYLYMTFDVVMM